MGNAGEMNQVNELKEITEKAVNTEELATRLESLEASLTEAVKAGSEDMENYYKSKIEQLKSARESGKEVSFGRMHDLDGDYFDERYDGKVRYPDGYRRVGNKQK